MCLDNGVHLIAVKPELPGTAGLHFVKAVGSLEQAGNALAELANMVRSIAEKLADPSKNPKYLQELREALGLEHPSPHP